MFKHPTVNAGKCRKTEMAPEHTGAPTARGRTVACTQEVAVNNPKSIYIITSRNHEAAYSVL